MVVTAEIWAHNEIVKIKGNLMDSKAITQQTSAVASGNRPSKAEQSTL